MKTLTVARSVLVSNVPGRWLAIHAGSSFMTRLAQARRKDE